MNKRKISLAIGAGLALAAAMALPGCGGDGVKPADVVLRHGYIYTVDGDDSVRESVAVRDGVLVYAGKDDGVQAYVGANTKVIELGGRMVMPGFVDAHLHSLAGGKALLGCDMQYAPLSAAQFKQKIQACLDAAADKEPDAWLEVANWDRQGMFAISGDPTKALLDELSTKRPILVTSTDFHTVLVNSRALALAGVVAATPDPAGGKFLRDGSNAPTGICEDEAGFVVRTAIPAESDADFLAQGRAALAALRQAGITSFMDAASGEPHHKTFSSLQTAGELTARAHLALTLSPEAARASPAKTIADASLLAKRYDQGAAKANAPGINARILKIFGDGVVNAPADTGGLLAPYFGNVGSEAAPNWQPGGNTGGDYYPPNVISPLLLEAAKSGLDVHVHATGDRTVRQVLDAVQAVRAQLPGADFRPAIAHAETVDPADYARFKSTDTMATMSFQWAQRAPYSIGETENHLGPARFARMEPFGSLRNAGARVVYGSDWPIDPLDEFLALKVGVTRSGDPANSHSASSIADIFVGKINDDPALSRADALRAITMNSAYQLRMEKQVGSIEVGKFADLIILEGNFMTMPEAELARNKVLLTMVGGKVVMARDAFAAVATAKAQSTRLFAASVSVPAASVHGIAGSRSGHSH